MSGVESDDVIRELLQRARAGDAGALGRLLDDYRDYLRTIAGDLLDRRMASRIDASDLVQQTCLSVHKQITGFQGDAPAQFIAWLRQVHERNVQNAIRDQLHAEKRDPARERPLDEIAPPAASGPTPSQHAMRSEERAQLARAIAQLPADERSVLRLRYLEGRTLNEIAIEMEMTRDAVLWLMKRAMRTIRGYLPRDER